VKFAPIRVPEGNHLRSNRKRTASTRISANLANYANTQRETLPFTPIREIRANSRPRKAYPTPFAPRAINPANSRHEDLSQRLPPSTLPVMPLLRSLLFATALLSISSLHGADLAFPASTGIPPPPRRVDGAGRSFGSPLWKRRARAHSPKPLRAKGPRIVVFEVRRYHRPQREIALGQRAFPHHRRANRPFPRDHVDQGRAANSNA